VAVIVDQEPWIVDHGSRIVEHGRVIVDPVLLLVEQTALLVEQRVLLVDPVPRIGEQRAGIAKHPPWIAGPEGVAFHRGGKKGCRV
jgi:hypothetical protein